MANENKMQDVIATSLQNIKNLIDTNTVIGTTSSATRAWIPTSAQAAAPV